MNTYATVNDITTLFRPLTPEEAARAEALLNTVSAELNMCAFNVGKNLPAMVEQNESLAEVAKQVTVDIVARALMTSTNQEPLTQYSQAALGYSVSGTYLVPGGGIFIKNAEKKKLGLLRPTYGSFEVYQYGNTRNHCKVNQ